MAGSHSLDVHLLRCSFIILLLHGNLQGCLPASFAFRWEVHCLVTQLSEDAVLCCGVCCCDALAWSPLLGWRSTKLHNRLGTGSHAGDQRIDGRCSDVLITITLTITRAHIALVSGEPFAALYNKITHILYSAHVQGSRRFTILIRKCSHIHTWTLTRWCQWPSLARWPCLAIIIYYLWVNVGDTESGHCQGACCSQWFFYVPLQGQWDGSAILCDHASHERYTVSSVEGWEINLHRPIPRTPGIEPGAATWQVHTLPLALLQPSCVFGSIMLLAWDLLMGLAIGIDGSSTYTDHNSVRPVQREWISWILSGCCQLLRPGWRPLCKVQTFSPRLNSIMLELETTLAEASPGPSCSSNVQRNHSIVCSPTVRLEICSPDPCPLSPWQQCHCPTDNQVTDWGFAWSDCVCWGGGGQQSSTRDCSDNTEVTWLVLGEYILIYPIHAHSWGGGVIRLHPRWLKVHILHLEHYLSLKFQTWGAWKVLPSGSWSQNFPRGACPQNIP